MNNDLEQFSEERLIELSRFKQASELAALARIALAAKQAKPVALVVIDKHTDEVMLDISDEGRDLQAGDALYTTPQPAHTEQDGWKLVPIEPTEKMKAAAEGEYSLKLAYKAMLRAAPKPENE